MFAGNSQPTPATAVPTDVPVFNMTVIIVIAVVTSCSVLVLVGILSAVCCVVAIAKRKSGTYSYRMKVCWGKRKFDV